MPIHDLGYRRWHGRITPQVWRWWVIAQTGIKIAWKNSWLRRLLLVAWLPAFYFGAGFFIYEQWLTRMEAARAEREAAREAVVETARRLIDSPGADLGSARRRAAMAGAATMAITAKDQALAQAQRRVQALLPGLRVSADRHAMWCWLMWIFFRHPQGLLMLLVVGMVAPPLVAKDVGSRAFLLYFSRPISRLEYVIGKLAVVWCFVLLISTAPALVLYVSGVLLSPELAVIGTTWDIPLRILGASAVLLVPTTTLALAISSMTTRSWLAGFAWYALWVFSFVAYAALWVSAQVEALQAAAETGEPQVVRLNEQWTLLSLYHTLGKVQGWVFGVEGDLASVAPSIALLGGITIVSLMVLVYRVSSPMRV
ncbi:MAG TPA: hypothetical protein EYP56_18310 [Planctomycetaceae bacterium]|nr:hypothetical protein [Planctomycetaceae bacterium]